ncbi:Crp/Fnr family transcriptional regulator [Anaerorhabdus sp.]|uniref:Crp/Fnr family transcriptional regulator n=1 Tax=Anaerorhabdus sp. TaxID=1872524 RepID=UPI002FC75D59
MNKIFDDLNQVDLQRIISKSTIIEYDKHDIIFSKGSNPEFLFVLLEGTVYVCDDSVDGKRNILTIVNEKNDCFGEVYLFMDLDYPYYSIAITKVKVLLIPKEVFLSEKVLTDRMYKFLAEKAYILSRKLQVLMKNSLREKILEVIKIKDVVYLKRYELAEYLGVSRPALSKEIYSLIDEGILELDEEGIMNIVER